MATHIRPAVKWAGGKSQLLPSFERLFPREPFSLYLEPFVGGGAVFFRLAPPRAVLIDNNPELINFYLVVRDRLESLIEDLKRHENTKEYYYALRALDPAALGRVARASRFLYLNKTAYNGLWRVNRRGRHNVPFGRYKNPKILDEENLRRASAALKGAEVVLGDFSDCLKFVEEGTFAYLDPPYQPISRTASFTSYTAESFGEEDQRRLSEIFRRLDEMGCKIMLSNSDTSFVRELYEGYDIVVVHAKRAINSKPDRRGPVAELVIRNYH